MTDGRPHGGIALYALVVMIAFGGVWFWADEGEAGVVRPLIGAIALAALGCALAGALLQSFADGRAEKRAAASKS